MELSISWSDGPYAYVSADIPKYRRLLLKLYKDHPDDVTMIAGNPDNSNPLLRENDNCVYCKVPLSWIKIKPPVKREFSEEQREASRIRFKEMWERKKNGPGDDSELLGAETE